MGSATKLPPVIIPRVSAYHRFRKRIHLACFLVFCLLPFFNIVRFDIPKQRFYFAGYELWISEFGIVFFAMMFLLFVVTAAAMVYGRIYCGYLCPQMIFSEASLAFESRVRRWITKRFIQWPVARRNTVTRAALYAAVLVASVFLSFVFISYFVEPRDLLSRLMHLDIVTAGGIAGAVTTLLTFLDFAFLRQHFCTTVCPYGYLQGMLTDGQTLLVHYRDPDHVCIECKKCVRICHMGIDIRDSPYQIECIHCGECIDACDEVLARLKKPGLIHYTWGEAGEVLNRDAEQAPKPWWYRAGLRDAKRGVVLLVLLFYASGLFLALSMRRAVLVRLSPDRATLYEIDSGGDVVNKFRLSISNRGSRAATVRVTVPDLPGSRIVKGGEAQGVQPGQTLIGELDIAAKPDMVAPGVSHFQFVVESQPEGKIDSIPMTFIAPQGKTK